MVFLFIKLLSIIRYKGVRYSKPVDDILLDEIARLGLGEVVRGSTFTYLVK